jgi:DNA-binding transcriptional ArsR family regulator
MGGKRLRHVEETHDVTTGELLTVSKTFAVKAEKSEEFFFTFLSALNVISGLSSASDIKILAILCSIAEYNTGKAILTADKRADMAKNIGVSSQAITNSISRLKKAGLICGARGIYEINPQYFWKGTTNEREKLLKSEGLNIVIKFRQQ